MRATLIDRGFQPMTEAVPVAGRDFMKGHGSYFGRGGIYWVDQKSDLLVSTLGTTTRLEQLPKQACDYIQALVSEALPFLEIYCETCDQHSPVNAIWCEHIWTCPPCKRISSSIERSRKWMGNSERCSHRFPRTQGKGASRL